MIRDDGTSRRHVERYFAFGPSRRIPTATATASAHPDGRLHRSVRHEVAIVVASVVVPVAVGAALIPFREELSQSIGLLMAIPVLLMAALAGPRSAAIAAIVAAFAFDVLHTVPYHRLTIDDPDDIVETLALLSIGLLAGVLAQRADRTERSARVRARELDAVIDFVVSTTSSSPPDRMVTDAGASVGALLSAASVDWRPGYRGAVGGVLQADGSLATPAASNHDARRSRDAALPSTIEIPVGTPPTEFGRFVVRCGDDARVSLEERRTAAAIAIVLAGVLDRQPQHDQPDRVRMPPRTTR